MKTLMIKSRVGAPFKVKGYYVGTHFFVHRDVRYNNRWRIAHIESGCSCDGQRYATRKIDAVDIIEKLEALDVPGWYWDFSELDEFPEVDISKVLKEVFFFSGFKLPNNHAGCPLIPLFNYRLTRSGYTSCVPFKGQRPKTETLRVKGEDAE